MNNFQQLNSTYFYCQNNPIGKRLFVCHLMIVLTTIKNPMGPITLVIEKKVLGIYLPEKRNVLSFRHQQVFYVALQTQSPFMFSKSNLIFFIRVKI